MLQERLEQSALITSRLSHDFGNYLTGIMGFTELSLSQAPADTLQHRFLSEVLQAARQGAEWIRRLHLFCRRGLAPAWPAVLASVIAETEKSLRCNGITNLRWQTNVTADLPLLAIDAAALQAALAELATNAWEATQGQPTFAVAARMVDLNAGDCSGLLGAAKPGRYIEITVSDGGDGFPADVWPRLFRDVFFSTKPRHRGLGLLVVYGILHRYGGGMRLEEPCPGRGASMRLCVPMAEVAGPRLGGAPRLLLAHANPLLYDAMRRILEICGCTVQSADSSATALGMYSGSAAQPFDLIITDTVLSHMTGFELARRILAHDGKASFLFLHTQPAFHGLSEEELLKRFPLLRWPLDPPALVQAVHKALTKA